MALAPNSPLVPIVLTSKGRVAELLLGVGNNQQARASDVNQIISYLNARASVNKSIVTQITTIATGVTLNAVMGTITTVSSTLAALTDTSFTLTNSNITANSVIFTSLSYATASAGSPVITRVIPAAGSAVIVIRNMHATNALNAVMKISFMVL